MICGIDPGLNGSVFLLDSSQSSGQVFDMPTLELRHRREIDGAALVSILSDARIEHVFIEELWAMPFLGREGGDGQARPGVTAAFGMGKCYARPLGIMDALRLPYTAVPPVRWKKALSVPAGKDAARARASQLMPQFAHLWMRKKDDGRAEAALIALYGARQLGEPRLVPRYDHLTDASGNPRLI